MPVAFKPDRYGVQVVHKWTSNTGRWVVFLGTHWVGSHQCWDSGAFQTTTGATQRLHFKTKEEAMISYDETKAALGKLKPHDDEHDKLHIFGPDGKPAN